MNKLRLAWEQMEKDRIRGLYGLLCAPTVVVSVRPESRYFLPLFAFVHFYIWVGFYYKAVGK